MQMYPGWSARDNYAVHKKRKKRKIKQVQQEEQEDHEELDPEQSADDGEHLLDQVSVVPVGYVLHVFCSCMEYRLL